MMITSNIYGSLYYTAADLEPSSNMIDFVFYNICERFSAAAVLNHRRPTRYTFLKILLLSFSCAGGSEGVVLNTLVQTEIFNLGLCYTTLTFSFFININTKNSVVSLLQLINVNKGLTLNYKMSPHHHFILCVKICHN